MKKILAFLCILCISVMSLTGCFSFIPNNDTDIDEKNEVSTAEVKLLGISASSVDNEVEEATVKMVKAALFTFAESDDATETDTEVVPSGETDDTTTTDSETTSEGTETKESDETSTDSSAEQETITTDIQRQYTVIYKTQTKINFTITLSNPKNHYIMDFRLKCSTSDDVKVKVGSKYWNINDADTFIRWDDAIDKSGNREATFELVLPNTEVSPDKISVKDMYYSDRDDGSNKTEVNMDNKENYTIYKVEENLVTCEMVSNSRTEYKFTVNKNSNSATITKFTCADIDYMSVEPNADGIYTMNSDGKILIEYEVPLADGIEPYKETIEVDVELIKITGTLKVYRNSYLSYKMSIDMQITGNGSDEIGMENYSLGVTITGYGIIELKIEETVSSPVKVDVNDEDWLKSNFLIIAGVPYNFYETFVF